MQALLITDQLDEETLLSIGLQTAGFSVRSTHGLEHTFETWPEDPADFILWAVSTCDENMVDLVAQLRAVAIVPLLIITYEIEEELHIRLLDKGADLVVFRPYSFRLLIQQIRSLSRRASPLLIKSDKEPR